MTTASVATAKKNIRPHVGIAGFIRRKIFVLQVFRSVLEEKLGMIKKIESIDDFMADVTK